MHWWSNRFSWFFFFLLQCLQHNIFQCVYVGSYNFFFATFAQLTWIFRQRTGIWTFLLFFWNFLDTYRINFWRLSIIFQVSAASNFFQRGDTLFVIGTRSFWKLIFMFIICFFILISYQWRMLVELWHLCIIISRYLFVRTTIIACMKQINVLIGLHEWITSST